jgi:hypothetical protein
MKQIRTFLVVLALGTSVAAGLLVADELGQPEGTVLLTVDGSIDIANSPEGLQFDLAMLDALENAEFETTTVWTDGPQVFRGVPISVLLDAVGVSSGTMIATALNDYQITWQVSDALESGAVIATRRNGRALEVRDKGPLWIVFPYDSDPKFRSETVYAHSIWQLAKISILE